MQLEIPVSLASDNALLFDQRSRGQIVDPMEEPAETTLRLLSTCVEAMGLMQVKIDELEGAIRHRLDAKTSAAAVAHAEVTALCAKVDAIESRMGNWLGAGVENAVAIRSDMTLVTDKVQRIESQVESRLDAGAQSLAAAQTDTTALQDRIDLVETRLGARIETGATAAIAAREESEALRQELDARRAATDGRIDAAGAEIAALGRDLTQLRAVLAEKDGRLDEAENRMARLEVRAQDFAARHADDVASARTEAANWRMRAETDVMGFEHLTQRIAALEAGLKTKLDETERTLVETTAENVRVKGESRIVEGASDRLRSRLATLDSTIADQRSRISCLQNKLATATYAIRFEHMSRTMATGGDHDILDLTTLATESLVSAA